MSLALMALIWLNEAEVAVEKATSQHWLPLNFPEIGRFRLATERFDTRNEALGELEKVRLEVNSEAWILKH